jgi:futalosine hydrolase
MDLLVVAATPFELGWVAAPARSLACGVGPVEAAAATAAAVAVTRPDAILHVGIAGARAASGLAIGTVVIGSRSTYSDIAAAIPVERDLEPDAALLAVLRDALPGAEVCEIATSAAVGRSAGGPVEAMEGFAVLRAASLAGVRAIELRVVSNIVEDTDRGRWDIPGALARLSEAGALAVAYLLRA